jgi:hypothetical protein
MQVCKHNIGKYLCGIVLKFVVWYNLNFRLPNNAWRIMVFYSYGSYLLQDTYLYISLIQSVSSCSSCVYPIHNFMSSTVDVQTPNNVVCKHNIGKYLFQHISNVTMDTFTFITFFDKSV